MKSLYRELRKNNTELTQEKAAELLYMSDRRLISIEQGETIPSPGDALNMSKLYEAPFLTQVYCRECCPIGQAYSYEVLDNVNLDPASIMLKLIGEWREAGDRMNRMLELVVNKNSEADFTPGQAEEFKKCLQEFLDVEHNLETLKISLNKFFDISEEVKIHNQKCIDRGYKKNRKGGIPC